MADAPLAARMRPRSFEEFVGQTHLVGPGKRAHEARGRRQPPVDDPVGPGRDRQDDARAPAGEPGGRRPDAALGGLLGRRRRAQGHGGGEGRALPHGAVRRRGAPLVEGAAGRAAAGRRGRDGDADRRHHREPLLLAEHAAAVAVPAAPPGAARAGRAQGADGPRAGRPRARIGCDRRQGDRRGARPPGRDRRRRRADGAHRTGGGGARRAGLRRARGHARSRRGGGADARPSCTTGRATPTTT